MEQVHHQWVVEEQEQELQDAALKGRQSLQHRKDGILHGVGVVPPSSFSKDPNAGAHSNVVRSVSADEPLIQKEEQLPSQEEEEVEEMANDVENASHFSDGYAAVGAATTGDAIDSTSQNKNSVYFDKQEGNEFNGLKGVQNGDGAWPVLPQSHGEGEIDIQVENSDMQNSLRNEIKNQCMKKIDYKVPSSSELSPLQNSSEVQATTVENFGDESSAKTGPNLIKEIDQQLEGLDVEAVLAKQETHDLFCPNCNSCITKRVILRKRKRNINNLDTNAKRDELDNKVVNSSAQEANQGDHVIATSDAGTIEPPAENYEPEREPEVFRCLSCFSFFIPLRNRIKLFPNFGGARGPETSQNPSITPASNLENPSSMAASKRNWFFSLFTSNERKNARGQGDSSVESSRTGPAEHHQSSSLTPHNETGHGGVNSPIPSTVKSAKIESRADSSINSSGASGNEPLADQKFPNSSFQNGLSSIQSPAQNSSDVMNNVVQKVTMDIIDFPAKEQLMNENVRTDVGEKKNDSVDMIKTVSKSVSVLLATAATAVHSNPGKPAKDAILKPYEESPILEKPQKDVDKTPKISQSNYSFSVQEAQSPARSFENDVASDKQSSGASIPSNLDSMKIQKDIEEEINLSVKQGFVKAEAFKSSTSQTEDNVRDKGAIATETHTQIYIGEQPRAEIAEPQEWEILKSIVYGGLIESITSLGIVSSAASSGAAPLNIIALGLANLIGGLFIIGRDLIELKNDHSEGDPQQQMNKQEDRYQELLGRRANFLLHAVVAVLSFLIFGSVPLVVYGLLIRKNYYAEVKFAVVLATSVACIIMLAIGKVCTRRPPKSYLKTVLKYVTLALATSGVSYVVGNLVKDVLEKLSPQESGLVLGMPLSSTTRMEPAWMSY